jgi:hypothetical protein
MEKQCMKGLFLRGKTSGGNAEVLQFRAQMIRRETGMVVWRMIV